MPFKKGHPGYKPVGAKAKTTLIREERRAMFEAKVSEKWLETIDKLLETEPKYVADQFIGKAADIIKAEIDSKSNLTKEQIAQINAIAFRGMKKEEKKQEQKEADAK